MEVEVEVEEGMHGEEYTAKCAVQRTGWRVGAGSLHNRAYAVRDEGDRLAQQLGKAIRHDL